MKTINVVAAIIRDADNRIFCTQRGYGPWQGWWEFPGGKIEPGEAPSVALQREIREELDATISVGALFDSIEYDYPEFHLSMLCFLCSLADGNFTLLEHEDACWLNLSDLHSLKWLPADELIIQKLELLI